MLNSSSEYTPITLPSLPDHEGYILKGSPLHGVPRNVYGVLATNPALLGLTPTVVNNLALGANRQLWIHRKRKYNLQEFISANIPVPEVLGSIGDLFGTYREILRGGVIPTIRSLAQVHFLPKGQVFIEGLEDGVRILDTDTATYRECCQLLTRHCILAVLICLFQPTLRCHESGEQTRRLERYFQTTVTEKGQVFVHFKLLFAENPLVRLLSGTVRESLTRGLGVLTSPTVGLHPVTGIEVICEALQEFRPCSLGISKIPPTAAS
jgi:hypothetical protein